SASAAGPFQYSRSRGRSPSGHRSIMPLSTPRARPRSMRRFRYAWRTSQASRSVDGTSNGDRAGVVAEAVDVDVDRAGRKQRGDLDGPLDDRDAVGVEQLLQADVEELGRTEDAIGVDVMNRQARAILVDQDEGRAGGRGRRAEGASEALDEARLAGAEIT